MKDEEDGSGSHLSLCYATFVGESSWVTEIEFSKAFGCRCGLRTEFFVSPRSVFFCSRGCVFG